MKLFSNWYGEVTDASHEEGAKEAWEEKNYRIQKAISRLEDYPCCMSTYLTVQEMKSARQMKETMINILKKELL
ncbi:MAG: hypothetical protein GY928_04070 [Colwellia sp.]|nr:hypothetical protein [Colwellia sp.]